MAVTRQDVEFVYQAILGRSPRNDAEYELWLANAADLRSLVHGIGFSDEASAHKGLSLPAFFNYNCDPDVQKRILPILRKLRPHKVKAASKIRVGRDYDGGYVMVDDFEGVKIAYSLGIKDDVSWDLHIADRGIDVFQYDHTIDALPVQHARFHWAKTGIGASEANEIETLDRVIAKNGHQGQMDMLLKCDIEGYEWDVFAGLSTSTLDAFRQIVIEVHYLQNLHDPYFCDKVRRAIDQLTAKHRVVHVHGNNCVAMAIVGGLAIPAVLELTLVRVDDRRAVSPSHEVFPTALDMPCCKTSADYWLGSFYMGLTANLADQGAENCRNDWDE
jgi:hypothetical protein